MVNRLFSPRPAPKMILLTSRHTDFGEVALLWEGHRNKAKILRIVLSRPGLTAHRIVHCSFADIKRASCLVIDRIADGIEAFLSGEDVRFPLEAVRLDLCPGFQRRVLRAEHRIPRGRVSSYARIATKIGSPGAARAVGTALANNPFPILIPCHRAVRSDGSVGGYQGGTGMKRILLEREGVVFDGRGRIVRPPWHY